MKKKEQKKRPRKSRKMMTMLMRMMKIQGKEEVGNCWKEEEEKLEEERADLKEFSHHFERLLKKSDMDLKKKKQMRMRKKMKMKMRKRK